MSQAFTGEIRMLPYTFAPMGWAWCNGQQVSIQTSQALYAVIGFVFGGDQRTYFNLPNLQGRTPMHFGTSTEGTPRPFASSGGNTQVTLTMNEMPMHTHTVNGSNVVGTLGAPSSTTYPSRDKLNPRYKANPAAIVAMSPNALATTGGIQPHDNVQPYLVVNHCICLDGVFPTRN